LFDNTKVNQALRLIMLSDSIALIQLNLFE